MNTILSVPCKCRWPSTAALVLPLLALFAAAGPAAAQPPGRLAAQVGWVHIHTRDSSEPLRTEMRVLGVPSRFESAGTAVSVGDANTLVLAGVYALTDHIDVKVEGGYPPRFDLYGEGSVSPPVALGLLSVDLGEHRPLARSRQWSPAILLQYQFRDPAAAWRPYLGLGVTYTWYTQVDLNDDFRQQLKARFGTPLAVLNGKLGGDTRVDATASAAFAPIFNAGLSYAFAPHWTLALSISHVGLSTESTISIRADDGSLLARSRTPIELDPLISALLLSYDF